MIALNRSSKTDEIVLKKISAEKLFKINFAISKKIHKLRMI